MSGVMRMFAVLAVLLLAGLALLWALCAVGREEVESLGVKGLLILGILGLASLAVGLISSRGKTTEKS